MNDFPRTMVGGVSLPRLIIGTNWFLGYSHFSLAKDKFIKGYQTRKNIAEIIAVFLRHGIDAIMGGIPVPLLHEAILDAQEQVGRKVIRIFTPLFDSVPGGPPEN